MTDLTKYKNEPQKKINSNTNEKGVQNDRLKFFHWSDLMPSSSTKNMVKVAVKNVYHVKTSFLFGFSMVITSRAR